MKNTKKVFILFLTLFIISIFFVNIANNIQAANFLEEQEGFKSGENPIGKAFGDTEEPTDLRDIVVKVIKVFLTFLGIIATIMIMTAGFKWMTARGNQDKVSEAKSQIINASIGLSIILASYIITDYIQDCVIDIMTGDDTIWMCR